MKEIKLLTSTSFKVKKELALMSFEGTMKEVIFKTKPDKNGDVVIYCMNPQRFKTTGQNSLFHKALGEYEAYHSFSSATECRNYYKKIGGLEKRTITKEPLNISEESKAKLWAFINTFPEEDKNEVVKRLSEKETVLMDSWAEIKQKMARVVLETLKNDMGMAGCPFEWNEEDIYFIGA